MLDIILKEETGVSEYKEHLFIIGLGISLTASGLITYDFLFNNKEPFSFLLFLFTFIEIISPFIYVFGLGKLSFLFIHFLRFTIPYEKETIYEKQKKYEIHLFPILGIKKFYYKGKIHREEGAAIISSDDSFYDKYYLNGKEVEKELFEKKKIKNKLTEF